MKRKLIDINESTFHSLNREASKSGTNLKKYIEDLLDERAKYLEDGSVCQYRFTSAREPSEAELSAIMDSAAESVTRKRQQNMADFFSAIENSISVAAK